MKLRHESVIVARERAHAVFDLLWRCHVFPTRERAYMWLGQLFHRPPQEAHIGRMSIEESARIEAEVARLLFSGNHLAGNGKEIGKWMSRAMLAENRLADLEGKPRPHGGP